MRKRYILAASTALILGSMATLAASQQSVPAGKAAANRPQLVIA